MSAYIRTFQPGGCFFLTVVTYNRQPVFAENSTIELLRDATRHVIRRHPFVIDATVVLPDHFHCIWQLPANDHDFSKRIRLIKRYVSTKLKTSVNKRREKNIWQRRFWEHCIKDDADWRVHMDYVHYNPVKHGFVTAPLLWPYSSFHRWAKEGFYESDWGRSEPVSIRDKCWE